MVELEWVPIAVISENGAAGLRQSLDRTLQASAGGERRCVPEKNLSGF